MLELMPAPPDAKPELAKDVNGSISGEHAVGAMALLVVENYVEYEADLVVEQEMEQVISELPEEVEVFMQAYSKARDYVVAAHYFGMHNWN